MDDVLNPWCHVCDKSVDEILKFHCAATTDTTFVVKCHGSVDEYIMPYPQYLSTHTYGDKFLYWLNHLFETDKNPDVMLAIRYGQGLL